MGGGRAGGTGRHWRDIEADRHNIRGEHISIDTIPLVGEQQLADAGARGSQAATGSGAGAGRSADGRPISKSRSARCGREDCW